MLMFFAILPVAVAAQNIQHVIYAKHLVKTYRAENVLSFAGNGTSVILAGDGKTGASITVQASAPVTLNGGFTVEKGASLHILSLPAKEAVTAATPATAQNGFRVYPNPAGRSVTIYLSAWEGSTKKELTITDISGKRLLRQNMQPGSTEFDVATLQRGSYWIVISASDGTQQTSRFVLQ